MDFKDIRNYIVAVIMPVIGGWLFLLFDEAGSMLYIGFLLLCVVIYLLTFWNGIGDYLITKLILRADNLPSTAAMSPTICAFYAAREAGPECRLYYTQSSTPYLIVLSNHKAIVSIAAESNILQYNIEDGVSYLCSEIEPEVFQTHSKISRKTVLLALLAIPLARKITDIISTILIRMVQITFGIAMVIATGALFGSLEDICNSCAWGRLLGALLMKFKDLTSLIQDKLVEFIVNLTQDMCILYTEEIHRIH